jgi:hypothetical protein
VALTAAVALTSTSLTAPELAPWMPKRALYRYVREIKDETTATRNILNCVRRTAHALDHAALTSFEHERAHYGPALRRPNFAFFVPIMSVDAQRRTERVCTLVATEYAERRVLSASPLWSQPSTLSTGWAARRGAWRGAWPMSMARSTRRSRCIGEF